MKVTAFADSDIASSTQGGSQSGGPAGGDLTGSMPTPAVSGIQGTPVSIVQPTTGQVLAFNGTQWAPTNSSATSDHKVLVDGSDTTADYLSPKLVAGTNITLTVQSPGGNESIKIDAAGGGALTHAYVGYNTAGASTETMTQYRVYMKSVSLTTGQTILTISAYVKCQTGDHVGSLSVGVFSDNSGTPLRILQYNHVVNTDVLTESAVGTPVARWLAAPINYYNDSGGSQTVWIAVMDSSAFPNQIAYDSGGDSYYTSGGGWFADAGFYTVTVSARKYSIRADVVN
jgi:hypothetical protein